MMAAAFIGRHISVGTNKYIGGMAMNVDGCEKVRHSSHNGLQILPYSAFGVCDSIGVWGERVVIAVDGVVAAAAQ